MDFLCTFPIDGLLDPSVLEEGPRWVEKKPGRRSVLNQRIRAL